jgi:hypothetical protein
MKPRIISAIINAITTLAFAYYFDSLYGGGGVTSHLALIHTAIVGAILFAVACILSLLNLRFGIACSLVACFLSWPFFAGELSVILGDWQNLLSDLPYANWKPKLAAVVMLIISSVYSVSRLRFSFRAPAVK